MIQLSTTRTDFAKAALALHVGIDLEFTQSGVPTLVCAASGTDESNYLGASLNWLEAKDLVRSLVHSDSVLVGHAITTVDAPIIEKNLGVKIPLTRLQDTYIWTYLLNADFAKTKEKKDGTESRGTGQLDLWTMASLYTELNQWKACKGSPCSGACPTHDPVGYNAMDGVGPALALPRMVEEARAKGVTVEAYNHVAALSVVCEKMERSGVKVDVPYLRQLDQRIKDAKANLFTFEDRPKIGKKGQELKTVERVWNAPFNPGSPKQVLEYFQAAGVNLKKTDRETLERAAKSYANLKSHDDTVLHWLETLHEFKSEGKGTAAWFDEEKYIDALGFVHPRFIACGTSTGRLASSRPNFQNIPKHGTWAKDLRRALVPRSSELDLLRADSKQLELRMVLYLAGVEDDYGDDAFSWLVRSAPGLFEEAQRTVSSDQYKSTKEHSPGVLKGQRQLAKRISHAGNYLEGFTVLYPSDINSSRTVDAVRAGALVIYPDWEYAGGVVGFTGTNLARALCDDASWGSRKKALEIQEAYFGRFPQIRQWHRKVTEAAERGYVNSITGRYLALRGSAEERAKECAAFWGQGGGADYVQRGMLALDAAGYTPLLNIHDENVVEIPRSMSDTDAYDLMQLMAGEFPALPGFRCPVDIERGPNYVDTRGLG